MVKLENVGILAILLGGAYLVYRYTLGSGVSTTPCDEFAGLPKALCEIGIFTTGYQDPPAPVVTQTEWCPTLGRFIDPALTCPTGADPYVPPVHITCPEGFVNVNEQCVRIPGTEPIPDTPYYPGYVDRCTWPNGDPLTVPAGMDCREAQEQICARFWSGYKGCP